MKWLAICSVALLSTSEAAAQACWREVEYLGEHVARAGHCHENVSDRDFERVHCRATSDGETLKRTNACPAELKLRDGARVVLQPIVASCLRFRPGMSEGVHNIYYYKDASFGKSRGSLQSHCLGHAGKWTEVKETKR
jgi:hypothetical protein